ncbi:unnamed protein product [Calypogeia fissa]
MAAPRQDSCQDGLQDSRQDNSPNTWRRPVASDLEDERDTERTKLRVVLNPGDAKRTNLGVVLNPADCNLGSSLQRKYRF